MGRRDGGHRRGRDLEVGAFPIGIDAADFARERRAWLRLTLINRALARRQEGIDDARKARAAERTREAARERVAWQEKAERFLADEGARVGLFEAGAGEKEVLGAMRARRVELAKQRYVDGKA